MPMTPNAFNKPERQSKIGIFFIFIANMYKLLRSLWVLAAYFLLSDFSEKTLLYVILGSIVAVIITLAYSYLDYRKFQFHINYASREFILNRGVFSSDYTAVPFSKIQQVYIEQSIFQRIIGIKSLVVDTAGSSEQEIRIKALKETKADQLKEILLGVLEEVEAASDSTINDAETSTKAEENAKAKWTYKLSIGTLLKIGLTSNYIRGIGLLFFFYSTIRNELNNLAIENSFLNNATNYVENTTKDGFQNVFFIVLVLVLIFFIGLFITVAEVFIKYFNLKLTQTKTSLVLEMGLKTTKHTALKPKRVQLYRVLTNPFQKAMNLYEVQLSITSSGDGLNKSKIKIPGLKSNYLERIYAFIFGKKTEKGTIYKPDKIWIFRRLMRFYFLPISILVISNYLLEFFDWEYIILIAIVLFLLIGVYQLIGFKKTKLSISENFIEKTGGVWTQKREVVEIFKLQGVSIKQPFWYKNRNLVNLTIHTAGGDLRYNLISTQVAKEINYMLYKIETSTEAWM